MKRTWISETPNAVESTVRLNGWVNTIRAMGDKLVFIDLRDGTGLVQLVCYKPGMDEATIELVDQLKPESAIEIEGEVQKRGAKQVNENMPTGEIEVGVKTLKILNLAKTPPFEINQDTSVVDEKVRLKHRYLDLRSERLQRNIRLRSDWVQACREYLFKEKFVEIETPLLTKATPEGSRDFVVPSRLQGISLHFRRVHSSTSSC